MNPSAGEPPASWQGAAAVERPAGGALPVLRIEPVRGWVGLNLRELWGARELLLFLAWRDVKVRYKQTLMGAAWAVLQPLLTMVVFSFVFGHFAKVPSGGVPYPLFAFAALIPWYFFSNSLTLASNSVVGSSNLLKKVYFPRLVIPLSSVLAALVDFGIGFSVLVLMMFGFGVLPGLGVLWLPLLLVLALVVALGTGLWLSALNVQFRDVKFAVPFLVQIWLLASPVGYPSSVVPEKWRLLFALNPMAGVVEGFRWALLGAGEPPGLLLLVSFATALSLLVSGAYVFRRMERTFADVV